MARKTNKTNHVLNLLSGGVETEASTPKAVKKAEVVATESSEALLDAEPNVSVVEASKETEGISESIRMSLEMEVDEMEQEAALANAKEQEAANAKEQELEQEAERQQLKEVVESEQPAPVHTSQDGDTMQEEQAAQQNPQEPPVQAEVTEEPVQEEQASSVTCGHPLADHLQATACCTAKPGEDFIMVNMMQLLVEEKAPMYMKQFGNCTCPRCVADVVALTLSNVPAKYVVVHPSAVSPLQNFYGQHFAGHLIVEITKACIRVAENPRHNK
jgi:competence protein ComFB